MAAIVNLTCGYKIVEKHPSSRGFSLQLKETWATERKKKEARKPLVGSNWLQTKHTNTWLH